MNCHGMLRWTALPKDLRLSIQQTIIVTSTALRATCRRSPKGKPAKKRPQLGEEAGAVSLGRDPLSAAFARRVAVNPEIVGRSHGTQKPGQSSSLLSPGCMAARSPPLRPLSEAQPCPLQGSTWLCRNERGPPSTNVAQYGLAALAP